MENGLYTCAELKLLIYEKPDGTGENVFVTVTNSHMLDDQIVLTGKSAAEFIRDMLTKLEECEKGEA